MDVSRGTALTLSVYCSSLLQLLLWPPVLSLVELTVEVLEQDSELELVDFELQLLFAEVISRLWSVDSLVELRLLVELVELQEQVTLDVDEHDGDDVDTEVVELYELSEVELQPTLLVVSHCVCSELSEVDDTDVVDGELLDADVVDSEVLVLVLMPQVLEQLSVEVELELFWQLSEVEEQLQLVLLVVCA